MAVLNSQMFVCAECLKKLAAADTSSHSAPAPTEGLQLVSKEFHPVKGVGHS